MKLLFYLWMMLTGGWSLEGPPPESDQPLPTAAGLRVDAYEEDNHATQLSGDSREVLNRRLIILEDTHFRKY
jgi:hypothetical protein